MRNIRQILESGNTSILLTIFNLFSLDDVETQTKFIQELARSIGDSMRLICRNEINKWNKKAGFGWKSAVGRLTNSKKLVQIVAGYYTRFEQLLSNVFMRDEVEIVDFTQARHEAFNNVLRDYDRTSKDENKSSLLALNLANHLLEVESSFTEDHQQLVKGRVSES